MVCTREWNMKETCTIYTTHARTYKNGMRTVSFLMRLLKNIYIRMWFWNTIFVCICAQFNVWIIMYGAQRSADWAHTHTYPLLLWHLINKCEAFFCLSYEQTRQLNFHILDEKQAWLKLKLRATTLKSYIIAVRSLIQAISANNFDSKRIKTVNENNRNSVAYRLRRRHRLL